MVKIQCLRKDGTYADYLEPKDYIIKRNYKTEIERIINKYL